MSGKLASWLGSTSLKATESVYPPANQSHFDYERIRGFRHALNSKALGQPTQNYMALASHMTGLVHISVDLLATMVSDAHLSLWEYTNRDPDGAVRLDRDDPIVQLYDNPNHVDTAQDLLYDQILNYELTGMALVWTPPDRDPNLPGAEIAEMWCLPRAGMVLHPPTPDYPQGYWEALPYGMYGNSTYGYFTAGCRIPAEQVMNFRKRHPYFRWEGYATLSAMSSSVSTLEGLESARLAAQLQGCEQSVAVEFDKDTITPSQEQIDRIRAQWFAEYGGPNNSGKLLFIGGGAKVNKFAATPADMAWTEGFDQLVNYLSAAFRTPKALLGMVDGLTHATLFAALKAQHLTKIRPLLNRLAARHTKDVLTPFYSNRVFMKLEADAVHDDQLLETQLQNDLKCGARTIGEYRQVRGLDLTGDAWEQERAWAKAESPREGDSASDSGLAPGDTRDQAAESGRDDNEAGEGSLGPSGTKKSRFGKDRAETLLHAMERYKSNGSIRDLQSKPWTNGHSFPVNGTST